MLIDKKPYWVCPDGSQIKNDEFDSIVKSLVRKGSKVYVGTDSMLRGDNCIFATVIAFHNNEEKIATYYYKNLEVTIQNTEA